MRIPLCLLLGCAGLYAQGNVPVGDWTGVSANGAPASALSYDKASWIPTIQAGCTFGAYHQTITSERNDAIVCYSAAENRYFILNHSGSFHDAHTSGMGHAVGVQWFDEVLNAFFYTVDGSGSNAQELFFGHLWQHDIAGLTTRDRGNVGTGIRPWINTTTTGSSCRDDIHHKTFIYPAPPGTTGIGVIYDSSTNTFTNATTTGMPPPRDFPAMAFNHDNGLCYVFGGIKTGGSITAEMYTMDLSSGSGTWAGPLSTTCTGADCTGSPSGPQPREAAFLAYSTVDHIFVVGGGGTTLGGGGTAYSDTWHLDPSTLAYNEITTTHTYPNNTGGPVFEKMFFDDVSNFFVLLSPGGSTPYAQGTWGSYTIKPYLYAISGTANPVLQYGRTVNTYTPASGSLNRTAPTATSNTALGSQSDAATPSITNDGTNLYVGFAESGDFFNSNTCNSIYHPFSASSANLGVSWTNLGNTCVDMSSEGTPAGALDGGYRMKTAVINGVLWAAWEQWNSNQSLQAVAYAKSWNGSAWSGGTVGCYISGGCTGGNGNNQWPAALIAVGTTPTIATVDASHAFLIGPATLRVSQWNGSSWAQVGSGQLNVGGGVTSRVLAADIVDMGSGNFDVCWVEEIDDGSNRANVVTESKLYCSAWNGSAFSSVFTGTSLNHTAGTWADAPSLARIGSTLYIAWTERTATGPQLAYMASWNGSTITTISGGAININTSTGIAYNPKLLADSSTGSVYVLWEEQTANGQPNWGRMKKWNGSFLTRIGGTIAADKTNGSIAGLNATLLNGKVFAVWSETSSIGNLRQIYSAQVLGSDLFPLPSPVFR